MTRWENLSLKANISSDTELKILTLSYGTNGAVIGVVAVTLAMQQGLTEDN